MVTSTNGKLSNRQSERKMVGWFNFAAGCFYRSSLLWMVGQRQTNRRTQRKRQEDRQIDIKTDREKERQIDTQTDRQTDKQRDSKK